MAQVMLDGLLQHRAREDLAERLGERAPGIGGRRRTRQPT